MYALDLRNTSLGYPKEITKDEVVISFPHSDIYLVLQGEKEIEIFAEFINGFSKVVNNQIRYSEAYNLLITHKLDYENKKSSYIVPYRINNGSNESFTINTGGDEIYRLFVKREKIQESSVNYFYDDIAMYTNCITSDKMLEEIIEDTTKIDNEESFNILRDIEIQFISLANASYTDMRDGYESQTSVANKYDNIKSIISTTPRVLVLMGCSGCGKNYIEKLLVNNNTRTMVKFSKIHQCTTRACRGEDDKDNYDFLSDDQYDAKVTLNKLFGRTEVNGNRYGSYIEDITKSETRNTIYTIILNALGLEDFFEKVKKYFLGISITVLYIENNYLDKDSRKDRNIEQEKIDDERALQKVIEESKKNDYFHVIRVINEPDNWKTEEDIINELEKIHFI